MGSKYIDKDIRWKWMADRGFNLLADKHQYAYAQSLFAPTDVVQGVFDDDAKAGTGKTTIAALMKCCAAPMNGSSTFATPSLSVTLGTCRERWRRKKRPTWPR